MVLSVPPPFSLISPPLRLSAVQTRSQRKKVSTDRPALLSPSGGLHQSFKEASKLAPPHSFYYSTSSAPVLLSSSNQHLELGRVSNMASGLKAAVWQHTTAEQGQTVKCECGADGSLHKCTPPSHKEELTHSYKQIWWHSATTLYAGGITGGDDPGRTAGARC